jgi:hypothetical protein
MGMLATLALLPNFYPLSNIGVLQSALRDSAISKMCKGESPL